MDRVRAKIPKFHSIQPTKGTAWNGKTEFRPEFHVELPWNLRGKVVNFSHNFSTGNSHGK